MTSTQTHFVPIVDIIPETPDTQTFRLGAYFPFEPGQALSLMIPGDPKVRYYSISSSPTETGHLDITIKADRDQPKLYGSLFTLNKGSRVEISGPFGKFFLPEKLEGPLCFLAAGTGIAPFRAMIKSLFDTHASADVWLIHSVPTPDDLVFREQFIEWSKNPIFHYVPTFTRWDDADLQAETGRIGEDLLKKHVPTASATFFLCGSKDFVSDMELVLTRLQVPAARIRREQW